MIVSFCLFLEEEDDFEESRDIANNHTWINSF
jgi:hypothetical protein